MMRGERKRTNNLTAFLTLMIMTLILIKKGGVVLLVTMSQIWPALMKREGGVLLTTMMATI